MAPARASRRTSVGAAVDIGAFSVHLLVAEVHGHRLVPVHDESATLGLGSVVDARGELGFEAGFGLVETLAGFAATARAKGASTISFVATDPLRRAADAEAVVAAIHGRTGVATEILAHDEEALLALLGVQAGRPLQRETVLIDVGGGSSEILVSGPGRMPQAVGLPLGAARLSRELVKGDPPTRGELGLMLEEARRVLEAAPEAEPQDLVAVGGTASNLLRIGTPLVRRVLTSRRIVSALEQLVTEPSDAISAAYGVKLSRAKVLPGGAAVLLAALERYGRDQIRVSTDGLREGLVLASVEAGPAWRADLVRLAHGWSL